MADANPAKPGKSGGPASSAHRPTFLPKLIEMLQNPRKFGTAVAWTADGKAVAFNHQNFIERIIKPGKHFRATKFGSIVKQLENYGFTASPIPGNRFVYKNSLFVKSRPHEWRLVKSRLQLAREGLAHGNAGAGVNSAGEDHSDWELGEVEEDTSPSSQSVSEDDNTGIIGPASAAAAAASRRPTAALDDAGAGSAADLAYDAYDAEAEAEAEAGSDTLWHTGTARAHPRRRNASRAAAAARSRAREEDVRAAALAAATRRADTHTRTFTGVYGADADAAVSAPSVSASASVSDAEAEAAREARELERLETGMEVEVDMGMEQDEDTLRASEMVAALAAASAPATAQAAYSDTEGFSDAAGAGGDHNNDTETESFQRQSESDAPAPPPKKRGRPPRAANGTVPRPAPAADRLRRRPQGTSAFGYGRNAFEYSDIVDEEEPSVIYRKHDRRRTLNGVMGPRHGVESKLQQRGAGGREHDNVMDKGTARSSSRRGTGVDGPALAVRRTSERQREHMLNAAREPLLSGRVRPRPRPPPDDEDENQRSDAESARSRASRGAREEERVLHYNEGPDGTIQWPVVPVANIKRHFINMRHRVQPFPLDYHPPIAVRKAYTAGTALYRQPETEVPLPPLPTWPDGTLAPATPDVCHWLASAAALPSTAASVEAEAPDGAPAAATEPLPALPVELEMR